MRIGGVVACHFPQHATDSFFVPQEIEERSIRRPPATHIGAYVRTQHVDDGRMRLQRFRHDEGEDAQYVLVRQRRQFLKNDR